MNAAMVMECAAKKRGKNRRSKNDLPVPSGETNGSVNEGQKQQFPEKELNGAFNSLPAIHIGNPELLVRHSAGEISRSCPLIPSTSSSSEAPTSNGNRLMRNPVKRKYFAPHWSEQAVEEAIEKGNAFRATFRVNAHNRLEAYCTIDGVPVDVLINGVTAQNRAVEGDIVAIMLDPVAYWTKLKGSSVPINPLLPDSESQEAGKNCARKEHMDINVLNSVDRHLCENGSTSASVSSYPEDRSRNTAPGVLNGCRVSEQGGAARALVKICALLNSSPSKRPTGKVVAIIKQSPRRRTVVGFLAAQELLTEGGHRKLTNVQLLKKDTNNMMLFDSRYIELLPTNPRFPKMVVSVSKLPYSAKERVRNGDFTIEKELVAAQIVEWNDESLFPEARVIHILGSGGEIEPQIAAILFANSIFSAKFSPDSLACLPELPWKIPIKELETRKDLRNVCTFTIDPSAAIDLDDALSVETISDNIFRIGVHIADVSYFVLPGTALDTEAHFRSTSVYIPQNKLPMLPSELSEGCCSLLPGLDRLTFSVIWDINRSGNIIHRWIGRSVIRSCCKLSYELVQDVIDGSLDADQFISPGSSIPQLHGHFEWKDVFNSLRSLHEISIRLKGNRFKDGALHLETSKLGFLFDEFGTPYDSFLEELKQSCSLVEEFMLLANTSVAEVTATAFPDSALLRRHPEPNARKLRDFEAFCSKHGFELDTSSSGRLHLSLSKIKEKLKDDPVLFDILVSYASRPMQCATYFCTGDLRGKENDWGHYALSVPFYTHFTSPLRRYPDIIVHRTLSATLEAEEMYLKQMHSLPYADKAKASCIEVVTRCFTGLYFDKNAAESEEGRKALTAAALKFEVPGREILSETAAYCNERKSASRHAEESGGKLHLWALLKKKEILVSEARVLALGPRFMSIYIHKLAIERRISYDDVEGLTVDWLEMTSTLVLDLPRNKRSHRRLTTRKARPIEEVALLLNPSDSTEADERAFDAEGNTEAGERAFDAERENTAPAFFPLVLQHLSTIPVVLHAIGGEDGPVDIGARLYMCSYYK